MRRSSFILLVLLTATSTAAGQQTTLDLIPGDAAAAAFVRHPDELKKKGDKFLADAVLDFGIRPTDLFDMALDALGLRQGIDFARPGGAVLLSPRNGKT